MANAVAVVGASGYAGGELLRLLVGHPTFVPTVVMAAASAGRSLDEVHPHLRAWAAAHGTVLQPADPTADVLRDVELVFTALPHGASGPFAAQLPAAPAVVDLGADHRLREAEQWHRAYGGPHAGTWVYGLPELPGGRAALAATSRVAVPGCYPTAVALALAPLVRPLVGDDVVVVAASGTSGAGRTGDGPPSADVMGSMSAYRVGGCHQHTAEMEQTLSEAAGRPVRVSFTPMLAPMPRGILATCSFRPASRVATTDAHTLLAEAYQDEPFVHVLPPGRWPRTGDVVGSNAASVQVAVDDHAGRVVVVCALDNLGKGAAGQAVQNANLMAGFAEVAGLTAVGIAP